MDRYLAMRINNHNRAILGDKLTMLAELSSLVENERATSAQIDVFVESVMRFVTLPTLDDIKDMHEQMFAHNAAYHPGKIRHVPALSWNNGEYPLLSERELNRKLNQLNRFLTVQNDVWYTLAYAHYEFTSYHPFVNGNGRIARLLIAIWCVVLDVPFIRISPDIKSTYIDLLATHNIEGLAQLFYENRME